MRKLVSFVVIIETCRQGDHYNVATSCFLQIELVACCNFGCERHLSSPKPSTLPTTGQTAIDAKYETGVC